MTVSLLRMKTVENDYIKKYEKDFNINLVDDRVIKEIYKVSDYNIDTELNILELYY